MASAARHRKSAMCKCGHPEEAHQHHRAGMDCSKNECKCKVFRRKWIGAK